MKRLLCFLVVLKFCLFTWPAVADTAINGKWLDYYEEGDSLRIDKGVSITSQTANELAGAYLKTGFWTWDFSDSIVTFRVRSTNWRDVNSLSLIITHSGLKFKESETLDIKQRLINPPNNEWIEVAVPVSAWIKYGVVNRSKINSILISISDLGYNRITVDIANIKITKNKSTAPIVSFSIDDGLKDTMQAAEIFDNYKIVGTAFIDPSTIGNPGYIMPVDVINLVFAGWDISGHRIGNLNKLSVEELNYHIIYTKKYLEFIGSSGSDLYALPNGATNNLVSESLSKHFKYIFNINGMANNTTAILPLSINRHSIDRHTRLKLAMSWVDSCIENNEWLIINFHTFSNDWSKEEDWSLDDLKSLIEYIQSKNVPILPISSVLRSIDYSK